MSEGIDISKLDKCDVLAALYNASKPQGLGMLHFTPETMTRDQAEKLLAEDRPPYFDYLQGRVMKINLAGDDLDPRLYDRDNGQGAAARAIATIGDESAPKPDALRNAMASGGEVPATCTMPGEMVAMIAVAEKARGRKVCWGCNSDRSVCKGEPKQ